MQANFNSSFIASAYVFLVAAFLMLIVKPLVSEGLFTDGLWYAILSRNLSIGEGHLWLPKLSSTMGSTSFGHPPLALWLQALFFKFLGDHIYVEKIYSVLTHLLQMYLLCIVAKRLPFLQKVPFLSLFFWMCFPLIYWLCANNMLENTMMLFTTLSVYFSIRALQNKTYVFAILSGFMVFLAIMSKGPVGLFPLSFFVFSFVFKVEQVSLKKAGSYFVLQSISAIAPFVLLWFFNEQAHYYFTNYIDQQLIGGALNEQTVPYRSWILIRFLKESAVVLVLSALIFMFSKSGTVYFKNTVLNSWVLLFFSVGLSGIIPIMLSVKQSGFYMAPSFPILATGFALIFSQKAFDTKPLTR